MEKMLTPMSELIVDLDLMAEEAMKIDSTTGKALSLTIDLIKKNMLDAKYLGLERKEIERACKAGLSGLPISSVNYYEKRFINEKDV